MEKGLAMIRDTGDFLSVSYEDIGVEEFGGADYEVNYALDGENRLKLKKALAADGCRGKLSAMILEHFGEYLDKDSFCGYCDDRRIRYELNTHVSN